MPHLNALLAGQRANPMYRIGALVHGRDDILHLEFGEPDFPTPPHIVEAGMRSLRDERQGYGPGAGIAELRAALAARVRRVNHLDVSPERIVVAAGGTGALMAALLTLCETGDEVLVSDPAWAGYDAMLAAAGTRMVRYPLRAEEGWLPGLDALEACVTPRSRVLLLNSPSNPGGAVFPRALVERLVELARRHDLWLLSDECYDEFVYEGEHVSPATLAPERVVTVGTFSKAYAMTGWRIGWAVAPAALAAPLGLAVAAAINNLPLFVQRAAMAALAGPQDCVREMAAAYRARRDLAAELLRAQGRLRAVPAGAFYLLAPLGEPGGPPVDSVAFAEALIAERGIAVAPGAAFGPATEGYARLSLASSPETLRAGITGLLDFATTKWQG
ncbi:MAG TPA: aminotransferase class I/II-fold pyridoxal phosphate-dependent enzyme [Ktedonobacterales bacterium]